MQIVFQKLAKPLAALAVALAFPAANALAAAPTGQFSCMISNNTSGLDAYYSQASQNTTGVHVASYMYLDFSSNTAQDVTAEVAGYGTTTPSNREPVITNGTLSVAPYTAAASVSPATTTTANVPVTNLYTATLTFTIQGTTYNSTFLLSPVNSGNTLIVMADRGQNILGLATGVCNKL